MDFDVIILGDYCLDLVFTGLPSMPVLGKEIEAKALSMEPGGACNTALALHQLGVKTAFAAEFGNDDYSQFVLNRFSSEGFPFDLFKISDHPVRKITVSLSFPQDRAFIAYYDPSQQIETALRALTQSSARLVVIPTLFYGPALTLGDVLASSRQMELFMDGNSMDASTLDKPAIKHALKRVRFYSPNHDEAVRITGQEDMKTAARMLGEHCQTVIVKDGANGCWCSDEGQIYYEPGYKVKVVDTTGAGDCFNAGFVKAWLDGRDIRSCMRFANMAGALSTQRAGANSYRLSTAEIETRLTQETK